MKNLLVFYNDNQNVFDNNSFSPSAGKPVHVVSRFAQSSYVKIISNWKPLSIDEISVAHNRQHVEDILNCQKSNGFGNTLPSVARSLPWTSGSFYRAAEYALFYNTATMSPTSGFHHSEWSSCGGYCTINGLMIAAILLHERNRANKIGIIDFDAHYGNGTDDIIEKLEISYIEHLTFGGFAERNQDFNKWLDELETSLIKQFSNCDILFYQAGADPHISDPLGGFLTTEQMKRRDEIVFRVAKKLNKPIVWNLAGGYQNPLEKVISLHENTLNACIENYFN